MFFSVVIPSHKRKNRLFELLKSLANQSFTDFEVIVVPTENDPAFDLLKEAWPFQLRMEFVVDDPSKGKSASAKRNFGARLASAPWIAFTDDDCLADEHWLESAHIALKDSNYQFAEGYVNIPKPDKPTFTYKGMKRLSRPGGFQTCNMFYKKSDFIELGGFDPNFPYYLEDTDLAWTFKESKRQSIFLEKAIITHPVPAAIPKKMLENAFRMKKLPYLKKKHKSTFKESNFRALPRPYIILIFLDFLIILSALLSPISTSIFFLSRFFLTLALLIRMLSGCHWQWQEFFAMFWYLLICPLISLVALIKGNIRHGVFLLIR